MAKALLIAEKPDLMRHIKEAYDLKGHEEPLQTIIHFADFWTAQFLEVGKLDKLKEPEKQEEGVE